MKGDRIPGLDELAFEGRNKAYGAYYLRKRYIRYLLYSFTIGILVLSLAISVSWAYYFFEPIPLVEGEVMYEVEYYTMSEPPDDATSELAQAFAKQEQAIEQTPVVVDSIRSEKPKPPEEPVQKPEDESANTDTAATSGGSGLGEGIGNDTGIASDFDVYPRYPGGDEARLFYLRRQVKYPEAAMKALIQGVVKVTFVVEVDGTITHVEVANRIGGGCDEEAIRVTKEMPRWEPAKRKGRAVRVVVRMPIMFRLPGKAVIGK
jgi:protein TonB